MQWLIFLKQLKQICSIRETTLGILFLLLWVTLMFVFLSVIVLSYGG